MDCANVQEKMLDYIDCQLSIKDKLCFEEHMQTCKKCRHMFEQYERMLLRIKNIGQLEAPSYLKARIMEKICKNKNRNILSVRATVATVGVVFASSVLYIYIKNEPIKEQARASYENESIVIESSEDDTESPSIASFSLSRGVARARKSTGVEYIYEKDITKEQENMMFSYHLVLEKGEKCVAYIENRQGDELQVYLKDVYDNVIGDTFSILPKEKIHLEFDIPKDIEKKDVYILSIVPEDKKYIDGYVRVGILKNEENKENKLDSNDTEK